MAAIQNEYALRRSRKALDSGGQRQRRGLARLRQRRFDGSADRQRFNHGSVAQNCRRFTGNAAEEQRLSVSQFGPWQIRRRYRARWFDDACAWEPVARAGDFNNDGFADILITNIGIDLLYRRTTATAPSAEVVSSKPSWPEPAMWLGVAHGAALGDFDGDGSLDLAVSGYVGRHSLHFFG